MSLLSKDIAKVKGLDVKKITSPATERRVEPPTPLQVERPPTDEEISYRRLVAINPLIDELVECLDLVSIKTGERIRKVETRDEITSSPASEINPQEIDKPTLLSLAQGVLQESHSYTKEEVIARIQEATNVSQERAERGFYLFLQAAAIETTPGGRYYLTGSTPF